MTDRELDALVAENIMGISISERDWPCGYSPEGYEAACYGISSWHTERGPVYRSDPDYEYRIPVPHYSTDIAAAWEVVEKFPEYNFTFGGAPGNRFCEMNHYETREQVAHARATSDPRAICLAALQAVNQPDAT